MHHSTESPETPDICPDWARAGALRYTFVPQLRENSHFSEHGELQLS
jgi:hypothetical protein